jgi:hypothetical protein
MVAVVAVSEGERLNQAEIKRVGLTVIDLAAPKGSMQVPSGNNWILGARADVVHVTPDGAVLVVDIVRAHPQLVVLRHAAIELLKLVDPTRDA